MDSTRNVSVVTAQLLRAAVKVIRRTVTKTSDAADFENAVGSIEGVASWHEDSARSPG